jgi:hypothetical protein
MTFLANLVLQKLDLEASLKVVGVLILVAAFLWAANVLVHARDNANERRAK